MLYLQKVATNKMLHYQFSTGTSVNRTDQTLLTNNQQNLPWIDFNMIVASNCGDIQLLIGWSCKRLMFNSQFLHTGTIEFT